MQNISIVAERVKARTRCRNARWWRQHRGLAFGWEVRAASKANGRDKPQSSLQQRVSNAAIAGLAWPVMGLASLSQPTTQAYGSASPARNALAKFSSSGAARSETAQ